MSNFSQKEANLFQFNLLVIGGLIDQGAIDGPKLRFFLEKRLEEPGPLQQHGGLMLLLQQAVDALGKWGNGTKAWTVQ